MRLAENVARTEDTANANKRMRWVGHVALIGVTRKAFNTLFGEVGVIIL